MVPVNATAAHSPHAGPKRGADVDGSEQGMEIAGAQVVLLPHGPHVGDLLVQDKGSVVSPLRATACLKQRVRDPDLQISDIDCE